MSEPTGSTLCIDLEYEFQYLKRKASRKTARLEDDKVDSDVGDFYILNRNMPGRLCGEKMTGNIDELPTKEEVGSGQPDEVYGYDKRKTYTKCLI